EEVKTTGTVASAAYQPFPYAMLRRLVTPLSERLVQTTPSGDVIIVLRSPTATKSPLPDPTAQSVFVAVVVCAVQARPSGDVSTVGIRDVLVCPTATNCPIA